MPLLIHTRRFPPRAYHAITLFPFVFYNGERLDEREVRHETVHLWQQAALLLVGFYLLYLLFWIWFLLRYRDFDKAYRSIPFERSAYLLEADKGVRPLVQAFHWMKCLKNNEI